MNERDIQDTYELELQLAKLILKGEPWQYVPREQVKFTRSGTSFTNRTGVIHISLPKYEGSREYQLLRLDIRHMFADLHCGFAKRTNFVWQRIAKKLQSIPQNYKAQDLVECRLCHTPSPLTTTELCIPCHKLYRTIEENKSLATQILEELKLFCLSTH